MNEQEIAELKVGDEVQYIAKCNKYTTILPYVKYGSVAKILFFGSSTNNWGILLEYKEYIKGHSGNLQKTHGKDGHCWWVQKGFLKGYKKIT